MITPILVDGAMGEGGGQVLRSDGAVDPWLADQLLLPLCCLPREIRTFFA